MVIKMYKRSFFILLLCFFVSPLVFSQSVTVEAIKSRGYLRCGVNPGLPGFSASGEDGVWKGFDVDFCKVLAVAILKDKDKVEYVPVTAQERFGSLSSNQIDVLLRNSTLTFSQDVSSDVAFAAINFFDGQGFMVSALSGVEHAYDLDGSSICVIKGSTSKDNLDRYFTNRQLKYRTIYFDDIDNMLMSFESGKCDAVTADMSSLVVQKSLLAHPGGSVILPEVISKEPLAISVRDSDIDFLKLVRWSLWATVHAEELGVGIGNVVQVLENPGDMVVRLFDLDDESVLPLGVDTDFVKDIIMQVGNYGDIFDRNLGVYSSIKLNRGQNALWKDGGLMYSPPF